MVTIQQRPHRRARSRTCRSPARHPWKASKPLNLRADGNVKLEILEAFDPDIFSSGGITLNAAVTGTMSKPVVNGRLQLQNASVNLAGRCRTASPTPTAPSTSTATEAVIQNLTGRPAAAKSTLSGFVSYGGPEMQFRLTANADKVSVELSGIGDDPGRARRLTLNGTTSRSLVSGR